MDVWSKVFLFGTLCAVCVAASVWDLKWRRIPNGLMITGLATGLLLRLSGAWLGTVAEAGGAWDILWDVLIDSLGGLLAGGLPWLLADLFGYWFSGKRSIGGGDMKFYGVCGVFLGLEGILLSYCVLAAVCVVVLGILCLCRLLKRKDRIPFAPLIAVAVLIAGVISL